MEKIKGLLKQIGASEELANQLCEELERHEKQIQEKYEGVYETKLGQAKKICVEEVAKYKVDLARKVRIFLEGKSNQIEKRLDQQRAIEEGEAKATLRQVREITEGIEVADNAELKALRERLEKLESKNVKLMEEKKNAIIAANRANKIALEIIERKGNEVVSEETKPGTKTETKSEAKTETKETKSQEVTVEGKTEAPKKKVVSEGAKKKVVQARPKTTRRTLTESQSRTVKKPGKTGLKADNDILNIANTIE